MDKIIASLVAAAVIAGAFLLSRVARKPLGPVDDDDLGPNIGTVRGGGLPVTQGSSPSGLRNNNPFNLEFRTSIQWRGQLGTDGRFVVFDTPLNGLRAGMINIHTKFTRDGIKTVRGLINVLSPSFENPTENFVAFVSGRLSVSPEQQLEFVQVIIPLSKAIVTFENGVPDGGFPDSLYREALLASGRS